MELLTYFLCLRNAGSHTGFGNANILVDDNKNWVENGLVGITVYNTTDGSWASIIANDATSITASLANGTENDWDEGDRYEIVDAVIDTGRHRANNSMVS